MDKPEGKRVIVGMSGGVDSSVAAYLLKEEGYEVIGVTMEIWPEKSDEKQAEEGGCCGLSAAEDAARVARKLGIPHYVMNFRREFENKVIRYFVEEYEKGHTPNPCIACNRHLKWGALMQKGLALGADYVATGHYAEVVCLPNGRYAFRESVDDSKDQTYALYNLTQEQLGHTLMPLGAYKKSEVRKIAENLGLVNAKKPDSQDICFVENNDYASFVEEYTGKSSNLGDFVDLDGRRLGTHKGIIHYTVGQRKGLGIAFGKPMYVVKIDPERNEVVLGTNDDLMVREVLAKDVNLMAVDRIEEPLRAIAKIRYNHRGAPCTVTLVDGVLKVMFDEPQRAPTKGQALVFYKDEVMFGGGTII